MIFWIFLGCLDANVQTKPPTESSVVIDQVVAENLQQVLKAYEGIRKSLIVDSDKDIDKNSNLIGNQAQKAQEKGDPKLKAAFQKLQGKAKVMASKSSGDIESFRESFSELSEALVEILLLDSTLQQGQYIFECPMVEGYQKWIQPDEKLENPYMGSKMLRCGEPSQWK
jgi:membrane fusion protein, copper/silver efflux system